MSILEFPIGDLHIVAWDDAFMPWAGPLVHDYFVTDKDERWFIHPDNIRIVNGLACIGERYPLEVSKAETPSDSGTWLDTAKHRIPFIPGGCLFQVPAGDDLPEDALRALGIRHQDLEVESPWRIVRCVYAAGPEAALALHRLALYFYLLGCDRLAAGDRQVGGNALARAIGAGPMFPHLYLLLAHLYQQETEKDPKGYAADHMRCLAIGLMDGTFSARGGQPRPEIQRMADDLHRLEMDEHRVMPVGDKLSIAAYIAAHTRSGPEDGTSEAARWLDTRRTLRQILNAGA